MTELSIKSKLGIKSVNEIEIDEEMDEVDKRAIGILINAPLMSKYELRHTISELRKTAQKKTKNKRKVNDILDYWANKAYAISMKS